MRIISKFKDYYDGGAVYGIDQERVYVREHQQDVDIDDTGIDLRYFEVIGFCGEIYVILNASEPEFYTHNDRVIKEWKRNPKDFILYNDDALENDFVNKDGFSFDDDRNTKPDDIFKLKPYDQDNYQFRWRKEYYDGLINNKKINELFLKYKVPTFHLKRGNRRTLLTLNPILQNFAFYRMYDTIQAFQKIEMFISSVLVSENQGDVPVGDDVTLAKSKGFNEWSFRKEKKQ